VDDICDLRAAGIACVTRSSSWGHAMKLPRRQFLHLAAGAAALSGLIVTGSALTAVHRNLIITLAAKHKLPAVYWERFFVTGGSPIFYGPDSIDPHWRAAG
jgi:hypothetical protein